MFIFVYAYTYTYVYVYIYTYMNTYIYDLVPDDAGVLVHQRSIFLFFPPKVLCFLNIQKRFSFSSNQKKNDGEFCPVPLAMQQLLGQMQNKHIDCMYV